MASIYKNILFNGGKYLFTVGRRWASCKVWSN